MRPALYVCFYEVSSYHIHVSFAVHKFSCMFTEEARPSYYGDMGTNPVTGKVEPVYPKWKRLVRFYFVSVPSVIFCLISESSVFSSLFSVFASIYCSTQPPSGTLARWLRESYDESQLFS